MESGGIRKVVVLEKLGCIKEKKSLLFGNQKSPRRSEDLTERPTELLRYLLITCKSHSKLYTNSSPIYT